MKIYTDTALRFFEFWSGGGLRIDSKRYGELCADCIQKLQKK